MTELVNPASSWWCRVPRSRWNRLYLSSSKIRWKHWSFVQFYCQRIREKISGIPRTGEAWFSPYKGSSNNHDSWGSFDFAKRSIIIGALEEGTLVIQVQMRQTEPDNLPSLSFVTGKPLCKMIVEKLFMDEKSSYLTFEVDSEKGKKSRTMSKTSTVTFHAHRCILEVCSSTLAELCESPKDDSTPVPIANVKRGIFGHMMYCECKAIINTANTYGVVNLKVEAWLVKSTTISMDTLIENNYFLCRCHELLSLRRQWWISLRMGQKCVRNWPMKMFLVILYRIYCRLLIRKGWEEMKV